MILGTVSGVSPIASPSKKTRAPVGKDSTVNEPVVGGMTWTEHVGERLLGVTGEDFEGTLSASVTFYASGRMFRSDWFRFKVQICDSKFFQIEAITMPAHRVHVLETETQGKFRLDLVQDVALTRQDKSENDE